MEFFFPILWFNKSIINFKLTKYQLKSTTDIEVSKNTISANIHMNY